jgi:hypothetical protein
MSTLEARKSGIARNTLSRTFQDAIEITRRLGLHYLWIDSLCIIQDNSADWESESSNMCSIYEQSFLMISATHGADGDAGCFAEIADDDRSYKVHATTSCGTPGILMRKSQSHHVDFANSCSYEQSLFTRAWALQERLLAPRIIHYTKNELIWECSSSACCECKMMPDWPLDNLKLSTAATLNNSANVREMAAQWRWLVMNYGSRELTCTSDILPALSGLAQKFSRGSVLGHYVAGLWENDLLDGLLWFSVGGVRPGRFLAPSWSWASVISDKLFYPEYCDKELRQRCRQGSLIKETTLLLLQIQCTFPNSSTNRTSTVAAGNIIVSGRLSEAVLEYEDTSTESSDSGVSDNGRGYILRKGEFAANVALDDPFGDRLSDAHTVYCLLIGDTWTDELWVLILKLHSAPNVYKRVGIGENHLGYNRLPSTGLTMDWFDDTDRRIITII